MKQLNKLCVCYAIAYSVAAVSSATGYEFPADEKIEDAVNAVRMVDVNGEGHEQAVAAMRILNSASPDQIPVILEGMDGANQLVVNWLRSAVIKIAGDGSTLPRREIRNYFDDKQRAHLGRLLAFDLLTENDSALREKLIPTLIDDPSLPLRYKAIASLIEKSKSAATSESIGMLGTAIDKARDVDQIIDIAGLLEEKGILIDLQKQLGFINAWKIVGNFDNKDEGGFDVVYGPEQALEEIDTTARYEDAADEAAEWRNHNTTDPGGVVDLNKVIGKVKGVIAYAHAVYESDADRTADIRIGCINAHKVWVNGKLVMSNEIYHNGISPDKFVGRADLKKGDNVILIKVCQNEQTQPWAQDWKFQLRVCDETGKPFRPEDNESESEDPDT